MLTAPRGLMLAAVTLAAACSAEPPRVRSGGDSALLHADHALAGRIWKPVEDRFVSSEEVGLALAAAEYVLLGEKHDNPAHHRIQAKLVAEMVAAGREPAVVFEMFARSQQAAIDSHLARYPGDSAGLGAATGWQKTGWPDWSMYQPVAAAALAAGGPLLAGGLDRETIRGVGRNGPNELGSERVRLLRLDEPIDAAMHAAMREEIDQSHCAQLPESMLDPMVSVTLAKDASMADALIRGAGSGPRRGAVLVAGDGHVRVDRGVPWHLRKRAASASIVSVGILEVVPDRVDPPAYAIRLGAERLPFDFVWFTARVDDADPCEVFAEQLRRARERHTGEAGAEND